MKIELTISTHTLGDYNTADDNQRYINAVITELQSEYPEADISVELELEATSGYCWVSDDPTGEIKENVNLIYNQVWEKSEY